MPFPKQTRRAFTRANVEALNPNQFGVYGLFREGRWIYVGQGDIRRRLLDHLNGDNPCITRERPTHWVDELTEFMDARETALFLELKPVCIQRFG